MVQAHAAPADGRAPRLMAVAGLCAIGLSACASTSPRMAAQGARPPQAAQPGGVYKLGAPYQANGVWYVPAEQPGYDEVGVASWYGNESNARFTANGERFDTAASSGAHTTLPLPSIVEVTNLENGRTIRVRLNDRGPFSGGRLIDLSRAAASQLGYLEKGTAKVRVRYLGPARLDGSLEPLFVAQAPPAAAAPPTPMEPVAMAPSPPPSPAPTSIAEASLPPLAPSPHSTWGGAPAPIPVAADGFSVQAGAFADRAKAERIAQDLSAAGAAAVRPVETAERRLYRVVLGPWRDEGRAQVARDQVVALGYADARVIKAF